VSLLNVHPLLQILLIELLVHFTDMYMPLSIEVKELSCGAKGMGLVYRWL